MHHILLNAGNITKESGPVSMTFTIPMYNASKLQVSCFDTEVVDSVKS